MFMKEPEVELIQIDASNIITGSCTTNATATPEMQACSTGAPHEDSCATEADDWVDTDEE